MSIHWSGGMVAMARVLAPTRFVALPATALDDCAHSLVFVDWAAAGWRVPANNADTAARIRAAAVPVRQADIDFDSDIRPFNLSEVTKVTDLGPSMGARHMVLQVVRASGEWAASSMPPLSERPVAAGGTSISPSELAARSRARCAAHLRVILGNMGTAAGLPALMSPGGWRQGAEWKLPLVEGAGASIVPSTTDCAEYSRAVQSTVRVRAAFPSIVMIQAGGRNQHVTTHVAASAVFPSSHLPSCPLSPLLQACCASRPPTCASGTASSHPP